MMERKDLVRGLVLAGICLGVLIYDWHFLAWPMHRVMALLVMTAVFTFAWFYELTMRDAPMGRVLTGVLAIMGGAVLLWLGLTLFARPLPDDATPLIAAGETLDMQGCAVPPGTLTVAVGADRITSRGRGAFVPFTVSGCAGPSLAVTPQGLVVNDFGYDGDGSVAFTLRHGLFQRLMGDWLHIHHPTAAAWASMASGRMKSSMSAIWGRVLCVCGALSVRRIPAGGGERRQRDGGRQPL